MPQVNKYKCDKCWFDLPDGWGYDFYLTNEKGKRIPSLPWGYTVEEVWGKGLSPELVCQLTGFNSDCLCLDCFRDFEADLGQLPGYDGSYITYNWPKEVYRWVAKDKKECPYCKSKNVKTALELIGTACPYCKAGVIEEIPTGKWLFD